jgi:hypothetical protein
MLTELANVSGDVEQEREPAHPSEELHLADHADLWRETPNRLEDLPEEGHHTKLAAAGHLGIQARIALLDEGAAEGQGSAERNACYDAQHFELGVTKEREDFRQVNISREVTKNVANPSYSAGPGVGGVLLM